MARPLRQEKWMVMNSQKLKFDIIKSVPADGKIYIEDIRAKGPDGAIRDLGTITIKIVK
jgi:hypothetical protein